MDLRFEKHYDKKVKKINKLREALNANPDNEALKSIIEEEEKKLYRFVMESGKELEKFIQSEIEDSEYEDE